MRRDLVSGSLLFTSSLLSQMLLKRDIVFSTSVYIENKSLIVQIISI